jgi:cytochrome c biogenesis protein CcdA
MFGVLAILIPILITDVINPVLLAAVIFALGTGKPIRNAVLILLGWMLTYFVSGILLAIGLDKLIDLLSNPRPVDFVIEIVLGILLLWIGYRVMRGNERPGKKKEFDKSESLGAVAAFWIGASINLIGMPFAIPYFAAIDQILKADLNTFEAISVLLTYNLLYIAPFTAVIVIRVIYRSESDALLMKINGWMEKIGAVLMPLLLFGLGIALIADAVFYFSSGKSLF